MLRVTLVIVASALVGVAVSAASGRSDVASAPSGTIAYSYRFWPEDPRIVDNWEIGIFAVGATESTNLTRFPQCSEVDPAWSRSGRWLAFACKYGPHAGIGIVSGDGSQRWRVVRAKSWGQWVEPAWSPDGRTLAVKGKKGIWVVNADGSRLRPLTRGMDGSPTWSADGRVIAFDRTIGGTRQIRRKAANGGRSRTIARNACCPVWSPDGRAIAFLKTGAPRSLWLMRSDGRSKHFVPRVPRGQGIYDVAWSPDGRYLAYYVGCCEESGIYITSLDGAHREHVWWGPEFQGISWGP